MDLADRAEERKMEIDLPISYIKKEVDEEEDDEDEEIEVDDIDDHYEGRKGCGGKLVLFDESATDDNSNDAKVHQTRLPILKSMLSPGEQPNEEKIGK